MPQMKVQPIDDDDSPPPIKNEISLVVKPQPAKSRFKRLLERQFPKLAGGNTITADAKEKDDVIEFEPCSLLLDKLVVSFIEDNNNNEKPLKCFNGNCFNGNCDDVTDDEFAGESQAIEASELVKGLVPCESVTERNLLADASKIVEKNSNKTMSKSNCIEIVIENLRSLGYDASICKSKWERSTLIPAGEYEYVDVVINGDRYILDVDFRSEFEIARSTKKYRSVLQSLPLILVGKADRVDKIITIVSEAARVSLKKKGLHFPPWRKLEYMKAKWLASYERKEAGGDDNGGNLDGARSIPAVKIDGKFEMRGEEMTEWTPPAVKPKSVMAGAKVVTGLASVLTGSD